MFASFSLRFRHFLHMKTRFSYGLNLFSFNDRRLCFCRKIRSLRFEDRFRFFLTFLSTSASLYVDKAENNTRQKAKTFTFELGSRCWVH